MTKEQFLTHENLVNILSDGTYGNDAVSISYGDCNEGGIIEHIKRVYEAAGKQPCREDMWAAIILAGGKLHIYDEYEDEDSEDYCKEVSKADFEKAFDLWRDNCPRHYADFCEENDDFYTGWSFIQHLQFGEEIYS